MNFTAIDFETANFDPDSACAIGLIKVKENKIIKQDYFLIKPPSNLFVFSYLHGITYQMVKNEPTFEKLWPKIRSYFRGVDFLAAHNASFDRSVLKACCDLYNIDFPGKEFRCTVKLAKDVLQIKPARLPDVCSALNIKLVKHHDAKYDAYACAKIVLKLGKKIW